MPNLVGIGNSQVPTNAMLGGLAYQDSVGEIDIDKIKARTSDTATDVFVYDTSKDSDGGAWRHRTQNTSWYNEGASATRGARKEFPAVAVIVVTEDDSRAIHIYDGDDPNLPMWMVIDTTDTQWPLTEFSSVTALNGIIALGSNSNEQPNYETRNRLDLYYFISDKIVSSGGSSGGSYYGTVRGLVNRRTHATYRGSSTGRSVYNLVNMRVNDVAMTVLPNAPIDTSTGLPIPTIAAATDGGTSIIKDDGTVVDIVYGSGASPNTAYVDFRKSDNAIVMSMNSNGSYVHVIYDIPTSDISGSHQYQKEGIDNEFYRTGSSSDWNQDVWIYAASPFGGDTVRIVNNVISGNGGINVLSPSKTAPATDTMVARITSSFNSGYMHGDIKGAFLSDTDDTNVTGTELVTNGTFGNTNASSVSSWTNVSIGTGTISEGSGYATLNRVNGSNTGRIGQGMNLVSGTRYVLSVDIVSGSTSGVQLRQYKSSDQSISGVVRTFSGSSARTISFTFACESGYDGFMMIPIDGGNTFCRIDNFSVRLAEEDRAKDNKGLQVFGTIQKDPVATGAELVSYSGFNGSNYLRQPYNSNLNFGTGDFSIIVWVKKSSFTTNHYIIDRARTAPWGGSTGRAYFIINSSGRHRYKLAGGSEQTGDIAMPTGVFNQIGFVRKSGEMQFWMNGVLVQTITGGNASASFDNGVDDQTVTVNRYANGFAYDYTFDGMALLRISGDAPSANQMKKMYDDEKCLFHENAKCTLHGTSDAVTSLAFDDTNDVLHVGTSAGRSEFQGLNRINNTTTAVTTAISASDGFVAEQ